MASDTRGQGLTRRRLFGLLPLPFFTRQTPPAPPDPPADPFGPDYFKCTVTTFEFWPGFEVHVKTLVTTREKWEGEWKECFPDMNEIELGPLVLGVMAEWDCEANWNMEGRGA